MSRTEFGTAPFAATSARSTARTREQPREPAYYVFPGTDITGGSARSDTVLALRPGDTLGGVLDQNTIYLFCHHSHNTQEDHSAIPIALDPNHEAVISLVPAESLVPADNTGSNDPGTINGTQSYVVHRMSRLHIRTVDTRAELPIDPAPFTICCRAEDNPINDPLVDRLYPPTYQRGSRPYLYVERSRGSQHLVAANRDPFTLEISPNRRPTQLEVSE